MYIVISGDFSDEDSNNSDNSIRNNRPGEYNNEEIRAHYVRKQQANNGRGEESGHLQQRSSRLRNSKYIAYVGFFLHGKSAFVVHRVRQRQDSSSHCKKML